MKLLLTNDDGYGAEGLEALWAAAEGLGERVMVAPAHPMSECSHQVTTRRALRIEQRGENRYAVDGTPADCVRLALHRLAPETDWVLSGINHGGNLGVDVYISGTVAAVREGVLHGWPGIALSHYHRDRMAYRWGEAAAWARPVLEDLLARAPEAGAFWVVNLPHLDPGSPAPHAVACPLDPESISTGRSLVGAGTI